ncbi:MAG: hypothetical protein KJ069_12225 [Anaerolineae bacterium]|nr:hypothetical protein [Anaerolineae bacterium]
MSLKNRLLGRKNRTAQWQKEPSLPLGVELDKHAFCGVSIGKHIDQLSGLGPAENIYNDVGMYQYLKQGFYLVEDNDLLETLVFILLPDQNTRPFTGMWRYQGRDLSISGQTTPKDMRWACGDPYHEFIEENEVLWFYEFPGVEWQFSWRADGLLESVEIGIPELAYPEARAFYGIKQPWSF